MYQINEVKSVEKKSKDSSMSKEQLRRFEKIKKEFLKARNKLRIFVFVNRLDFSFIFNLLANNLVNFSSR